MNMPYNYKDACSRTITKSRRITETATLRKMFDSFLLMLLLSTLILICKASTVQANAGCVFHTLDGQSAESEGVRFIRLREDAELGKEILMLRAYPRSTIRLRSADNTGDHKYFGLNELNTTTVVINLTRSLEDLVDRDVPKNLLKFRILCAAKNEKLEEGSSLSVTVYIEDVNDNSPEFLNTPYVIDVDENTAPGTIVFEGIQAFDRDKPNTPNSEVHFSMSTVPEQLSADGSPYFALKSPHRPLLILKRELDFDNGIRLFKLPLFAWDRGTPAHQVNTTITINVRDVDDLPPRFTEGVYRSKVNEFYPMTGATVRIPLYFSPPIMAYDQDSLNASLIYDIISGNERKLFRVNPNNGVMYLTKEIDLEEESLPGNTFVLQIEARQRDNPLKKALARIEVEVLDLNDNVPEFEADFYNISIVENLPTGFSVLQVNAVDRDQGENAEFLYNLIEDPTAKGAFRIDSRSGWITVRDDRLLDREQRRSLQLKVEAVERKASYMDEKKMQKPGPSSVKVEITLLDTNDNTPKFEQGNLYEFKVPLTAPVGYMIGQIVAYDPDEGPNGLLQYELQRPKGSGHIPFRLDNKNGTLYVNGPLRRGRIAVFVEASDQPLNPSERRFSLAVITVEVYATIDDQAIDFIGAPYEFWVGANAPLGTSVGQVRTTLINDGEDDIMYDLLHTYSEGVPFAIEERSGIITVIRELSEFSRRDYYFEAVANYLFANSTQPLVMSRSSQPITTIPAPDLTDEGVLITNVTIHLIHGTTTSTNSGLKVPLRPVIEEINMNIITFHIEENIVGGIIGQLLYKNGINVLNNDVGTYRDLQGSANITMGSRFRSRNQRQQTRRRKPRRLVSDSGIQLRYIIANQQEVMNKISITEDGTLLTITALDREQRDKYDLTVIVEYTAGMVSGAGIYQVNVLVDDVNDNAPKFNGLTYVGLINENSAQHVEIAMNQPILITDADLGVNAEFHVVLQGDYSDQFTIEYFNGTRELQIATNASQHSHIPRAETFNVFNLTDQWNDEMRFVEMQTAFRQTNLNFNNGPYFRLTYTGKRQLDREKDQLYNFKILAIDSGGLSSFALLNVLVADVNDNAPVFERISVFKDSKVEIREYTTDMEIYFVESSLGHMMPPPAGAVAMLPPYHIPGQPRFHSSMDSMLSFNATMPQARARGRARSKQRMRSRRTRAAPMKCPLFGIYEDTPLATTVLQVTATDEDFGKNAEVHYAITGEVVERPTGGATFGSKLMGVRHFAIDKISGELMVNYPLSGNIEIHLNLSASDIDGLKDNTCLRFTVIDVNDHAPVFKKSWYSFDTEEGGYMDSVLGQVLAVDLDYGLNANLTYSLNASNIPFSIKPSSGVLRITGALDREQRDKYSFQVIATDGAEPLLRLSTAVDVEVNVLDVNDNKPEFIGYDELGRAEIYIADIADRTQMLPIYKAYLERDSKPGAFVKQVTAIDKDYLGNGNGLVLYTLHYQDTHAPILRIDSRDGSISTVSSFSSYNDYEHLNVTVVAADLGSPAHSSTAIVLINLQGNAVTEPTTTSTSTEKLLDPQLNSSLFQHQFYEVSLLENNAPPTAIVQINLTANQQAEQYRWTISLEHEAEQEKNDNEDADENDSEENSAELMAALRSSFTFDSQTLTLTALTPFDRELHSKYQIRLRAERLREREGRTYVKLAYPVIDERIEGLEWNECRILLHILDENDNEPRFKSGGQPIIAVVPRSANFGYPISTVEATDLDEGINAAIRYRILNEPTHLFAIDEVSGKIRLIGTVPIAERVYGFDVKATDRNGADDGRSSIINVFVYVIDEAKQVRIVVAGRPVDVERRIDALMKVLSDTLQMDVRVRLLEPHLGSLEPATDAYIYAVDFRTNAVMEMEQLQDSLAGLQLDALQLRQANSHGMPPRIIELAEFGEWAHKPKAASFMSSLEIITVVMIALVGMATAVAALCFLCIRQKRRLWSQQEFPSSETGLTYTIAQADIDSCRKFRNRTGSSGHRHHHHLPSSHQSHFTKANRPSSGFMSESVCSSGKTQSTAVATDKLEQQQQQHQQQQQQNTYISKHQQHLQQVNDQRQREYIDVPLPKSIAKAAAAAATRAAAAAAAAISMEPDATNSPFVLKYNACQPVNNLTPQGMSPNNYDSSLFSFHSNGQDSGVDFLSSRELYETSPDSITAGQNSKLNNNTQLNVSKRHLKRRDTLCPRHAKEHMEARKLKATNGLPATDSSDNYEDSLKNAEALVASNCRGTCELHQQLRHSHNHHHQHQQQHQRHFRHDYQNTHFEKRSCVRHSFSGVKDDLMQNSPQLALRPRSHILRNSMNDLEERLHNLEQSFQRPIDFSKSSSIY